MENVQKLWKTYKNHENVQKSLKMYKNHGKNIEITEIFRPNE